MEALRKKEKVGYAFGDFASCLIWQSISVYMLYYFTNAAGIETTAAVSIISISKLLDGLSDILMGLIVDRTKTRWGKVRPYLLTMGLPLSFSTVMLFSIPATLGIHAKLVWIFVWYNMVTTVFYTALNVPYSSMHCFLTDDSSERSKLSILRLIFAFSSQILINGLVFTLVRKLGSGELTDQAGWTRTFILIGTVAFLLVLYTFASTKERVSGESAIGRVTLKDSLRSILRNRYLLILLLATLFSYLAMSFSSGAAAYYAQYILHQVDATGWITNATTACQVICLIFLLPLLIKHYAKAIIYRSGNLILVLVCFLTALKPASLPYILVMNAIKGAAFAATGSMIYAMCADSIDYGEWKTGISSAGFGTALLQCMGKFGMAFGTAILGVALKVGGFEAAADVQSASAQTALVAVYTWIPGIFLALTAITMFWYRLDGIYPKIIQELRERRKQ